jgi:hypothetical protein
MKRYNFPETKAARKEASIKRQEERNNRSDAEQLKLLDQQGHVAKKERERLAKKAAK